jgi:hypothetical protein
MRRRPHELLHDGKIPHNQLTKQKTMLKKDGTKKQTTASLNEAMKCGECLHFKQTPHPSFESVCGIMGVRTFAIAPKCYTPDYTKVIKNTDEFLSLVTFFNSKSAQQKRIMLGMLRQQPTGKKLKMGTKMYLNVRGREYIDNYVCGYVVGYTSAGQLVLSGSPDRTTRGRSFFAYLRSDNSLLTDAEWRKRFSELKSKGRITDPKAIGGRDITAVVSQDDYEVPTIDNAPKEKGPIKKLSKRKTDLVQILTF